jgi:hypothetical protein
MKTFVLLAVGLAWLFAVSAQDVTMTMYNGNECTGALAPPSGGPNPFTFKVGVCLPEPNRDSTKPGTGSKIISCDGKIATIRFYLNDDSKMTSSCLRQDTTQQDYIQNLNLCYAAGGPSGSTGSVKFTSTCNTPAPAPAPTPAPAPPGATVATGSGSRITIGFLAFSVFLSSVVAALTL